jgi:hypothetical protein
MSLNDIEVPLYNSLKEEKSKKLIVNEFAGRIILTISDKERSIEVECYWEDLKRAWEAVRRWR